MYSAIKHASPTRSTAALKLASAFLITAVTSSAIASPTMPKTHTLHQQNYVETDRYTLVSIETQQEQVSPLLGLVDIRFGATVRTVGHAIREVLRGSGYRWDLEKNNNVLLTSFPLAEINRQLGPMRLQDALITLGGTAWVLHVDDFRRTVWFTPAD